MDFETLKVRQEGAVLLADIAAPPMNLLGTELVRDLVSLIQGAEAHPTFQVIVFGSADPGYFISHVDVTRISEYREQAAKLTGGEAVDRVAVSVSEQSRLVTIAQIVGRVGGAGSEFRTGVRHALCGSGIVDLQSTRTRIWPDLRRRRHSALSCCWAGSRRPRYAACPAWVARRGSLMIHELNSFTMQGFSSMTTVPPRTRE